MEKPTDYEKRLSILVLRCLGCSQDVTRSILHCRSESVVEVEQWFTTCPLDTAVSFCDDQAIKRLVGREFPVLEEISSELLVKAGQITADDILRHYRQDYLYGRPKHEEEQKFSGLLQQWRRQLEFSSVDQLLRKFYFGNWWTQLQRELAEPEEVSRLYLEVYGQHWETIPRPYKAILPVEGESLFTQLKKLHPDAEVWRAQESWDKAYGIYLEAFISWVMEIVYNAELLMGLAASEDISSDLDNRVANARQLVKMAKRAKPDVWLFLRLLAVVVACDLLVLGIQEQPPSATWCGEVTEILKLRDDVVLTSRKELPEDFWLDGENRVYAIAKPLWDKDKLVKEKTTALLRALNELRKAQDNVRDKLRALELSLSDDSSILTSGKT